MAETIGLRATSFAASAALLGFGVIAALSVSVTLQALPDLGTPPVPIVTIKPDTPPPPPTVRRNDPPPVREQVEAQTDAPAATEFTETELPAETIWQPPAPAEIVNPRWLERPRDLARYYPSRALARGLEGHVMLDCAVSTGGTLNCAVIAENPPEWGFGAAALRIAREHRMAPAMRDGVAVEGRYRMRVPFEVR